jgi:hypothetical protein
MTLNAFVGGADKPDDGVVEMDISNWMTATAKDLLLLRVVILIYD